MADARVVRLRGEREQPAAAGGEPSEGIPHEGVVEPQVIRAQGQVGDLGAARHRGYADAVDGVVVVGDEQELVARVERVGIRHELAGAARVRREHHHVLVGGGAQEGEDVTASRGGELRRYPGCGVHRVGVAHHVLAEQVLVLGEL